MCFSTPAVIISQPAPRVVTTAIRTCGSTCMAYFLVAACRRACGCAWKYNSLLVPLADAADEAVLEIDRVLVEADRFADAQPAAVEELCECAVAHRERRRAHRGVEEPFHLAGRERAGQRPTALRKLDLRR